MNQEQKIQSKEDVLNFLKENEVTFVNVWFPDVLGQLKSFSIHKSEMVGALEEGMGFDGSP